MLRQLTGDKVAELHHTIDLRRNDGFDAARNVVLDDSGKSSMDQIRIIVAKVQVHAQNEIRRMEAKSEAKRNNVGVAIMFVDLDGFKTVNDTLGHEGGDKLLIDVAERFKATARETDLLALGRR